MSLPFFLCGVVRVVVPTAFTTIAFTSPETCLMLAPPFGLTVLFTALYDARERRARARR